MVMYYTHGECFRVIWGLSGQHLVRSSFYPSRQLTKKHKKIISHSDPDEIFKVLHILNRLVETLLER